MNTEEKLKIPCPTCGSLPEIAHADPAYLQCSNERCAESPFMIIADEWPRVLTHAEKEAAFADGEV